MVPQKGNFYKTSKQLFKGVTTFIKSTDLFSDKEFKVMNVSLGFEHDYTIKVHLFLYKNQERYVAFINNPEIEVLHKDTETKDNSELMKCKVVFRIKNVKSLDELEEFLLEKKGD